MMITFLKIFIWIMTLILFSNFKIQLNNDLFMSFIMLLLFSYLGFLAYLTIAF